MFAFVAPRKLSAPGLSAPGAGRPAPAPAPVAPGPYKNYKLSAFSGSYKNCKLSALSASLGSASPAARPCKTAKIYLSEKREFFSFPARSFALPACVYFRASRQGFDIRSFVAGRLAEKESAVKKKKTFVFELPVLSEEEKSEAGFDSEISFELRFEAGFGFYSLAEAREFKKGLHSLLAKYFEACGGDSYGMSGSGVEEGEISLWLGGDKLTKIEGIFFERTKEQIEEAAKEEREERESQDSSRIAVFADNTFSKV